MGIGGGTGNGPGGEDGADEYNRDHGVGPLAARCSKGSPVARSRLLVAVSTAWASDRVFQTVRDLAKRLRASVVVPHVAQPNEEDESEVDTRQRGELTLKTLADKLDEAGITVETELLFGDDVAKAVLNAAEAHKVTLIVLGASGKGRMARLLAGDVPQQVLRQVDRPVLVFPPDWSGVRDSTTSISRVAATWGVTLAWSG